jgi:hypothetical protein
MARAIPDLTRFRVRGDPEADEALRNILQELDKIPPKTQGDEPLSKTLGKWDPSYGTMHKLPKPVQDYLKLPYDDLPKWIDLDRVERAQEMFKPHAAGARIVLATYSLPILYLHPEISLTLSGTGRLIGHVRDRVNDTLSFFDAVIKPGSLRPGGLGLLWLRKLRLLHALIRGQRKPHTARSITGGNVDNVSSLKMNPISKDRLRVWLEYGATDVMPLDQVELALVLQTFGWVMVDGLAKMGWKMRRSDSTEHIYAWSVIGHMLGIETELLPGSSEHAIDARQLFEHLREEMLALGDPFDKKDDDGRLQGHLLTAALVTLLIQVQRETTPPALIKWLVCLPFLDEALQHLPRILMRRLCGVRAARRLRLGRAPLLYWLICRLALALLDIRKLASEHKPKPSGSELAGALV